MKRSSTCSGPSCSGFWDTVRNNLTVREMTALMGGDGTMEQQTEKDFRFENVFRAPYFEQLPCNQDFYIDKEELICIQYPAM